MTRGSAARTLESLSLSRCLLTDAMLRELRHLHALRRLDLSWLNDNSNVSWAVLLEALAELPLLAELVLTGNAHILRGLDDPAPAVCALATLQASLTSLTLPSLYAPSLHHLLHMRALVTLGHDFLCSYEQTDQTLPERWHWHKRWPSTLRCSRHHGGR